MSTCHCTLTSRLLSKTHSASIAIPSASETAGGDAASKEVVIEADTSVPGGDAVAERRVGLLCWEVGLHWKGLQRRLRLHA